MVIRSILKLWKIFGGLFRIIKLIRNETKNNKFRMTLNGDTNKFIRVFDSTSKERNLNLIPFTFKARFKVTNQLDL